MMQTYNEDQAISMRDQEIAKNIASLLNTNAINIDAKIASKLSYGRQKVLANMATPSSRLALSQHGVLRLLGDYWHQHRLLITFMMCGLGIVALLLIQNSSNQDDTEQGDAFLLASDLPPEIYSNEGFGTWLSENTQQ
jgi:hypothetical protein